MFSQDLYVTIHAHMEEVRNREVVVLAALVVTTPPLLLLMLPPFGTAAIIGMDSSCTRSCGDISIFYPFGVEPGCYHATGFNLICNHSYQPPMLFFGDGTVQVLQIFLSNNTVRVNSSSMELKITGGGDGRTVNTTWEVSFPYYLSERSHNMLHAQGCNIQVDLQGKVHNNLISSCTAMCSSPSDDDMGMDKSFFTCTGIGCCQTGIALGYSQYNIQIHYLNLSSSAVSMLVFDDGVPPVLKFLPELQVLPVVTLDWVISSSTCPLDGSAPECLSAHSSCSNSTARGHAGYMCECVEGYLGNPYIVDGCQALGPCEHLKGFPCYGDCLNLGGNSYCQCPKGTYGDPFTKDGCTMIKRSFAGLSIGLGISSIISILSLALGGPLLIRKIKLQKVKKMKEKFFNQNHGLLLKHLISQNSDIGERMIVTLEELEKATNNFDRARVIGGGGHGIVFKGIIDLHVVAIKKSKIIVQREIDEFINEVVILSQVNHRNVVKLLGCCLEAEVPLLVYEFISNGTLYHHLHIEGSISIPWDDRIRIALEVARALSYLHSAASIPIFHRDIKSSNILLDDNLTAKVSDFGASRHIPIDKTGVTTAVQGTIGYLDPMYYYTGRLTDKSDVFSFGVLLIELLTRKKPYVYRSANDDGLVSHFVSLLAEGDLVEIIDPQVIEEEDGEMNEVATLAAVCTKLNSEDRPTMREVEMTLENLIVKKKYNGTKTRNDGNQTVTRYMPIDRDIKDASRQYTMEEEMLLSASYPR